MARPNGPKKPLGESIRDLINPALEDARRTQYQLDILNGIFEEVVSNGLGSLRSKYNALFNQASSRDLDQKNIFVLRALTKGEYTPTLAMELPLNTAFTNFSADDIRGLPGYIALHELARAEDVAIKLVGLTNEERSGQAILIIDGSKTYTEGALESSRLYPDLPPLPPPPPVVNPQQQGLNGDFNF